MTDNDIARAMLDASLTILEQCEIKDEMFKVAIERMIKRGCHQLIAQNAVSTVAQTLNKVNGTEYKLPSPLTILQ